MKLAPVLMIIGILLTSLPSNSQVVSKDSINILNQKKDIIELEKSVNTQKLKLAALENSREPKQRDMESARQEAQKSADENATIASKLSSNPDDRRLALKTKLAAKSAKRYAKKSRSATDDFEKLEKEIDTRKKKLADDEEKLSSLRSM
jgi:hypothetical protein